MRWVGALWGQEFPLLVRYASTVLELLQFLAYSGLNSGGRVPLHLGICLILQHSVHLRRVFGAIHDHRCMAFVRWEDDNVGVLSETLDGFVHTFVEVALGGAGPAECLAYTYSQ